MINPALCYGICTKKDHGYNFYGFIGADVFKFFANIQFDMNKINSLIEENLAETQERLKYANTLKSRGLHIPDLADTLMKLLLKKFTITAYIILKLESTLY